MNKYEKALLFNLKVIKILFVIDVLVNLFMPVYSNGDLGIKSLFQWIIVIINFVGVINAMGYMDQHVPTLEWGVVRILQVLWHVFISSTGMNWVFFFIMLISDLLFMIMLFMDKSNFKYERVDIVERDDE